MEYRAVERAIMERGVEWDFEPTLDRVTALLDLLGDPQKAYPVVHIAGTNGKTSTARMTEVLLRERNLRVGRFTSPHLVSMRERIVVDGEPLCEERFVEVYEEVLPYVELLEQDGGRRIQFFELLTAMAFAAFADTPVDVAVVEAGMGGSWDATNAADGAISIITPISLDHMDRLGQDVATIAGEKAGIIKPKTKVVLAQQELAAAEVLVRRATEMRAKMFREGLEFGVLSREMAVGGQLLKLQGLKEVYDDVYLPLYGAYQASNAASALAAAEVLTVGDDPMDADLVRQAFAQMTSPGRLEVVRREPTVVVDAAHNPSGMKAMIGALGESFGFAKIIGVVAMMRDKDVTGLLELLEPVLGEIVVTANSSPRSMSAAELGELAKNYFDEERVHVVERMDDALDRAIGIADAEGEFSGTGVLVAGSVVTAGDARHLLKARSEG